ncbi:hypothetical protein [Streptomyces sp. NPDC004376]
MTAAPAATTQHDPVAAALNESYGSIRFLSRERIAEHDAVLRAEIRRLSPIARSMAEDKPHRSRDWYALVNAADLADDALQFGVCESHLAVLADAVLELREVIAA